jgi:uncharacterized OB-fold protein
MSAPAKKRGKQLADPRPAVVFEDGSHRLVGGRCTANGHALIRAFARCPRCGSETVEEHFGPGGTVWATTDVHVPGFPGEEVPYTLAYVDLDDGPRTLLRILDSGPPPVGARVVLDAATSTGNVTGRVTA